jgi:hypothetical protein
VRLLRERDTRNLPSCGVGLRLSIGLGAISHLHRIRNKNSLVRIRYARMIDR